MLAGVSPSVRPSVRPLPVVRPLRVISRDATSLYSVNETYHKDLSCEWKSLKRFQGQRLKIKLMTKPNATLAETCITRTDS